MAIRNETLYKKLKEKESALLLKIAPIRDELEMIQEMLQRFDSHNEKMVKGAEADMGLTNSSNED